MSKQQTVLNRMPNIME